MSIQNPPLQSGINHLHLKGPESTKVACPKFGHYALSSEFYNFALKSEFVGMPWKNKITIIQLLNNFKTNSPITIFAKIFFTCKN